MSNIEKIKAEIERLMRETNDTQFEKGERYMCRTILDFIDSLPEEKPSEDLEEAAEDYTDSKSWAKENYLTPYIRESFIAGAEWQKEQDQPITGNSLEQEWLRYMDKYKKENRGELPLLGEYGWLMIAGHFAEWQKSQMLKDAVEGEAEELYNDGESQCTVGVGTYFKPGDEVYVIKKED